MSAAGPEHPAQSSEHRAFRRRPPGEGATVRTASWPRPAPGLSGPLCPHQDSGSSACRFPKAALIGRLVLCSFLPPLFSLLL